MSRLPLVSILIPCHNAELWIARTLESALAQTWVNKEIIVVDDGSTDKSLRIARTFEALGVIVISQVNQGASAARNAALRACQGDFIQYLDADDLIDPEKIEHQVSMLQKSSVGAIATCEWARFYSQPSEACFVSQPLWKDMSPVDWLLCAWGEQWMMHPAAWLIPKSVARQAGDWNEKLSLNDDGEYFSRVVLVSTQIKFCAGAKVYYRSGNSGSLSATLSPTAYLSAYVSWKLCTNALLAVEDSPRTRQVCATVFQRFIYEVYPEVPEILAQAAARVRQLGGSRLHPVGGPSFQILARLLGWQRAKRLKSLLYRYGYQKAAIGWRMANLLKQRSYYFNRDIFG
ncbi:MAG: glycosyltransferase family A protein [Phormidesmis sp.]